MRMKLGVRVWLGAALGHRRPMVGPGGDLSRQGTGPSACGLREREGVQRLWDE